MAQEPNLFANMVDHDEKITLGKEIEVDAPSATVIPSEVVLEPLLTGIRVTARDENHRTLWGFIASEGMLRQEHCLIAVYDSLQTRLAEELRKSGLQSGEHQHGVECANQAVDELLRMAESLRKLIAVKKVSDATLRRAELIRSVATDASRMISLVMKSTAICADDSSAENET